MLAAKSVGMGSVPDVLLKVKGRSTPSEEDLRSILELLRHLAAVLRERVTVG